MDTVWVHTPSVGEYNTVKPLLELLKRKNHRLVLTYSSPRASGFLSNQSLPDEVVHLSIPTLVWGKNLDRFLEVYKPDVLILVESDRYPALLSAKVEKKFIVNARISDRSFSFLKLFKNLYAKLFNGFDKILCKDRKNCAKFRSLGVNPKILTPCGNLKAVFSPKAVNPPISCEGFVITAGSTHRGEEKILLDAFGEIKKRIPSAVLILAPRHPQRAKEVFNLARSKFPNAKLLLRSQLFSPHFGGDILIVDTLGELLGFYKIASVTFVGGSLVPIGGHNLLEPAYFGKPVMFGPFVGKFTDLAELLRDIGLAYPVRGVRDIVQTVVEIYRRGVPQGGNLQGISHRVLECYRRELSPLL